MERHKELSGSFRKLDAVTKKKIEMNKSDLINPVVNSLKRNVN